MATRTASAQPAPMAAGQHTSGIFADMTVDGPEIGTLVVIVDRAKNLPNRKAMGKQNPYCAARLGKEAKKTDTDKRGGQTPKWDQELRFTVHDSLDYHNLKLSVFSEDKKTDLVGEAWINLDSVITAGGGKSDMWQPLNCKGKYSGEIRIELTYYDSRPRPEKKQEEAVPRQVSDRVKRRPLPAGPSNARGVTPSTIPSPAIPGRARHGPRDLQAPLRANSLPLEPVQQQPAPTLPVQQFQPPDLYGHPLSHINSEPNLPIPVHTEYEEKYTDLRTHSEPQIADFLPTLPPANRQRGQYMPEPQHLPPQPVHHGQVYQAPFPSQHQPTPLPLPHAHSDPIVPQQHDFYNDQNMETTLYTAAPEPLHDLEYQHGYVQQRQRHSDVGHHWEEEQHSPVLQHHQPVIQQHAPPPPPSHSRSMSALPGASYSAPVTPQHNAMYDVPRALATGRPVSRGQQQYISNISPLQLIERGHFEAQESPSYRPLPRETPESDYQPLPRDPIRSDYQPLPREGPDMDMHSPHTQPRYLPSQHTPQHRRPLQSEHAAHRHSIATPYAAQGLRHSPHPLSQEMPRARSPIPDFHDRAYPHAVHGENDRYQAELNRTAITPVVKPRAISPSRQTASDGPRQSDWRPKSTYSIQSPIRSFESSTESPLSHSRPRQNGTLRKSVSPHPSPAQPRMSTAVPYGPDSFDVHNPAASVASRDEPSEGPITGWDGREIDPSDHLPVASWAPEPEIKTPNKAYGLGRDRDFGPRSAEAAGRFSKDTVLNVHRKGASADNTPSNTIRARLIKKSHGHGTSQPSSPAAPLQEHPNYNPVPDSYAQGDYGRQAYYTPPKPRYSSGHPYHQGPDLPPKVPVEMEYQADSYGADALSREIASIDIGSGPRGRGTGPSPVAYVPVRSHRDRDSFY